jgi:hypothetical protein
MKCYWWNKWLHERKRQADVLFLLPSLQLAAERKMEGFDFVNSEEWYRKREQLIDQAFELHKQLPGQEHWHCECANEFNNRTNPPSL